MATTFQTAGKGVDDIIARVMRQYHEELTKEGVTIHAIFAARINKHGEEFRALKKDGHNVAAKIQITSLQDRTRNIADAKLTIDRKAWNSMHDNMKLALVDHELAHLKVAHSRPTKRNGYDDSPKRDDLNRPMLKIRPHDWVLTGFADVAKRHGESSVEIASLTQFRHEYGNQFVLPGVPEPTPKAKKASAKGKLLSTSCGRRHHKKCADAICECSCHHPSEVAVNE